MNVESFRMSEWCLLVHLLTAHTAPSLAVWLFQFHPLVCLSHHHKLNEFQVTESELQVDVISHSSLLWLTELTLPLHQASV